MDDIQHQIPKKPVRFLDQLGYSISQAGLSYRTEQTYIHWVIVELLFSSGLRSAELLSLRCQLVSKTIQQVYSDS